MAQVGYSVWLRDVGIFATSELPHYAYIEHSQATLYIQSSRLRDHETIVQRLFLQAGAQLRFECFGKTPLLGFRWQDGMVFDKCQIKFDSDEAYSSFTQSLLRYLPIQAPVSMPNGQQAQVPSQTHRFMRHNTGALSLPDAFARAVAPTVSSVTPDAIVETPAETPPQGSAPSLSSTQTQTQTQTLSGTQTSSAGDSTLKRLAAATRIMQGQGQAQAMPARATEAQAMTEAEMDVRLAAFLKDERCLALLQAVEKRFVAAGLHQSL